MSKERLNYAELDLLGKEIHVTLKSGVALSGEVKFLSKDVLVLVREPKSSLDIETDVVHTIVQRSEVVVTQFKTKR